MDKVENGTTIWIPSHHILSQLRSKCKRVGLHKESIGEMLVRELNLDTNEARNND